MHSFVKMTSTFIFGLALAIGMVGFVAVHADAQDPVQSQQVYVCATGTDQNGLPTCPPGPCGRFGLSTCQWHNCYDENGNYLGLLCGC